ncbi:PP2C family serine/threonine-protein phosphatase [Rodentibacter caecimuris]|uniref:PP2C family serine/threonine-protein phosphatase n=1 Tax=Rodentibacter caecimuris TaxID=1796644 RepID=UPI0021501904|nr:PP2C family serine/threonine-protein phosphatase [Pasteurella caecimuris]MCR1837207.1 protein phosphatase 2C domain-containing protein [Pasteurella caecimuris]MCU0106290.1 protein phosphatase 2C domain-containing protein [Pasteurella caecimuris]
MMNATEQLEKIKSWLNQADEKHIDAFASQNQTLISHISEMWQRFQNSKNITSLENNMLIIKPTEITPVQKKDFIIALPNAKQGEPYFYQKTDDLPLIQSIKLEDEIGLVWNTEKQTLEGSPIKSGEFLLMFQLADGNTVHSSLFINPDPKYLWKNIPSDPNKTRFWKSDSASELISTENGKLIAARMRGRTHAMKGTCCDDDFSIGYHEKSKIHFIAIADGAGSRQGSKLAVNAAKDKFFELLNIEGKDYQKLTQKNKQELAYITKVMFKDAVQAAYLAQETAAKDNVIEQKSLSCTLLLAFTLPLIDRKWFTACYWVGDGAAAIFDPVTQHIKLLGEVDTGQYSGETQFLTLGEANAEKITMRICTDIRNAPPTLMLMTDGVSDPKFHSDAQLNTFEAWKTFWQELHEPLQEKNPEKSLETWLNFFSKGEHDDRTLAMFIPQSEWLAITHTTALQEDTPILVPVVENPQEVTTDSERTIYVTQHNEAKVISLSKASDVIIQEGENNE